MYRVTIRFCSEFVWKAMRDILCDANVDYEAGKKSGGYYYIKIGKQRKPYVV